MQKNNLLYVITKLELGGAQNQLLSLIGRLDQEKFAPFLFTAQGGLLFPEASRIRGLNIRQSLFLGRPINPLFDFISLIEICNFIKKNKIHIVHTHSSKAGIIGRWAAKLCGVKIIIHTVHGWSYNRYQFFLLRKLFVWLERLAGRFTDILIVVSEHDKNTGLTNRIGRPEQYEIIRYGIERDILPADDFTIKKELGINNTDLMVIMVACFKPQKAPQDFIKLASLVTQAKPYLGAKFILVGDGLLRNDLKRLIFRYGLKDKVILAGWRKDVLKILSVSDLFVLTSLWEGLPISALEAISLSKPVVITDTGGITEIIREGITGFLVKPRDTQVMAKRVIFLLENKEIRDRMGLRSREALGSDFDIRDMVKNTESLYYRLIKQNMNCDDN